MARAKQLEVGPQIIELGDDRQLRLLDVLGKGSSATVYRALYSTSAMGVRKRERLERAVAVKLFSLVSSDEAEAVLTPLLRSARRVACLDHPNIAHIYECGMWRGRPFVVTELVDGVSLSMLQEAYAAKQRRLPLDLALFVGAEVGEALAGARVARDHEGVQLGMVHQAVSARDVLLSWRGEVKVTDFEASTTHAASSAVRSLRGVAGRVSGMAPEVAQGCPADARSDVFSFGVLLRELFIGARFPPSLKNAEAVALAREGYVEPVTFQPHLPDGLLAIMSRALENDPDLRYPNACAMAFDLRREAFAMGVGDGRYFLRRALEREWPQYAEEITAQRPFGTPANEPERPSAQRRSSRSVIELPRRK